MNLSAPFIARPVATTLLTVGLALAGMVAFFAIGYLFVSLNGRRIMVAACLAGAVSFTFLAVTSAFKIDIIIFGSVMMMGLSKGIYNVGLSHLTMSLVTEKNSGLFMGMWNFISGIAIALGESTGGGLKDLFFLLTGKNSTAYAIIFSVEAVGFILCLTILVKIKKWAEK